MTSSTPRGAHEACEPEAFEAKYVRDPDPWSFRTSDYEQRRYAATLDALGRERYGTAFEAGCSIGELTWQLATRCDYLRAVDVSPTAIDRAKARCGERPTTDIAVADLRTWRPDRDFDLILLSEVGYYFETHVLAAIADRVTAGLAPRGEVLAVHWLGQSDDHLLHGDEVHRILDERLCLARTFSARHREFRIDRWEAP